MITNLHDGINLYDRKKVEEALRDLEQEDRDYILGSMRKAGEFARVMQMRIDDLEEKVADMGVKLDQDYLIPKIYNRARFDKDLEQSIADADKSGKQFALIMIDIDGFKKYNDTQGHPKGDKLLRTLAYCLRREEVLYRYGGEEFGVLLPGTSLEQGTKAALRLRKAVEEYFRRAGNITISLGVGVYDSSEEHENMKNKMLSVLQKADKALYHAKECGKNRVEAYTEALANIPTKI
jgi:diguanylate cyclase (GGDEF)-like protein